DPNVLFYNPAGIKTIEHIPISFSFVKHLMDINSASLASTFEIAGIGKFGAAIQYVNYGNFTEANQFGDRTGEFGAGDLALILGYANSISENFYYGANLKFIYSNIDDVSSTGLAVDLGLQYLLLDDGWNFGFSVLNLGSQLTAYYNTKEDLPLDVQLGLSKKLAHVPIQFFFSFNKLNAAENRFDYFNAGLEFTLGKAIELRFGYNNKERKDLKIGSTAGLAGYSFGLGVNISSYKFDYAFSSMGSIGALHRIGIAATLN
ncbi:MAG: PorV/PorQ family protein, partial [Melioribacteraceae bacterium]|nr:PorV/PorQ family protein [Melioribacteraceae bacterium]